MKENKALELLMQVEPGMVLVNKRDFSLLIVRNLGGGRYLCISEENKIVIIDLLEELKSEKNIVGIYTLPNSQECANQNALDNEVREVDDKDEDMYWSNGAIQRAVWLSVPKEKAEDKSELPPFLQMLEELLTVLSDNCPTGKAKIVPLKEGGEAGFMIVIKVPKE